MMTMDNEGLRERKPAELNQDGTEDSEPSPERQKMKKTVGRTPDGTGE